MTGGRAGARDDAPDRLTTLLDAVWGPPTPDQSPGAAPAYIAVPSTRRAQVVLARDHPAGVARYLTDSVGLRTPAQAALRRVAAGLVRSGALRVPGIGTPVDTASRRTMVTGFHHTLSHHLGTHVASVAFSVRRLSPNWKPTFAAMAPDGRVLGYGKVGWDKGSSRRVTTEARALHRWEQHSWPGLHVPHCLTLFDWSGRTVMVVSPIPAGAQRYDNHAVAPLTWVALQLQDGPADAPAGRIAEEYLSCFSADQLGQPSAARAVEVFLDRHGGTLVPVGAAHGDWVPWNVATLGDQLWAWDLEHALDEAPLGLDIVHWYVLVATHLRDSSRPSALRQGGRQASDQLSQLGLTPEQTAAITRLGLLRLVALRREFLSWDPPPSDVAALVAGALS